MNREGVAAWVAGYEQVWRTAGTDGLRRLFAEDASYRMHPAAEPVVGLDAIAQLWDEEREGPDETFDLTSEVVAVDGDTAVVRVSVRYALPREAFLDLWILRFDPLGRCTAFEEWAMTAG